MNDFHQAKLIFDKMQKDLDINVMKARDEMMTTLIGLAKKEIKGQRISTGVSATGKTRYYEPAISGQPPMNRTGNLRNSILGIKETVGPFRYSGVVGPTVIYGRKVELGGLNWKPGTKFPYMKPAYEKFKPLIGPIVNKHLRGL